MSAFDVDTVVIGAGVVGLAVAREITRNGGEVMVLERHDAPGMETSSRNSEVIHAGLYYPAGSLRARLCVRGRDLLYEFVRDNGVAHARCGKLIVATTEAELSSLDDIAAKAHRNGVADVVHLDADAAHALEPQVACVGALLSPSTGIIDSHGLIAALEGHVTSAGGQVVYRTEVRRVAPRTGGGFALEIESGGTADTLTARRVVNAAGLSANSLGRDLHDALGTTYQPPRLYPAKGHYSR